MEEIIIVMIIIIIMQNRLLEPFFDIFLCKLARMGKDLLISGEYSSEMKSAFERHS